MTPSSQQGIPSSTETLKQLEVDPRQGLSAVAVNQRQAQYGLNAIEEKKTHPLVKFLSYFWGPIPWMIEAAAILSGVVQHWEDFGVILAMLLINAGVGFWQEHKASNEIEALKQRLAPRARVLRDGNWSDIDAKELVPGDIVRLRIGSIVPGDGQILSGENITADESALTGESLPVEKAIDDPIYSGCIVKSGNLNAVITATGMRTYFAKSAELVKEAETTSHFQKAVLRIGNFLIGVTAILVLAILIVSWLRGDPLTEVLLFALVLTVAAIPVALPAVLSVTMAIGAGRLARMKAIVSRLVSIEEMAGMNILCADKTGTLTKNELETAEPALVEAENPKEVLVHAALTIDPSQGDQDPIDKAILKAINEDESLQAFNQLELHSFDPVKKRAEATVERDGKQIKVAKGAPQVLMELCETDGSLHDKVQRAIEDFAAKGYRALGVAATDENGAWHYLGVLPMWDPPRDDSAETLAQSYERGLDIKMVTGDHLAIAKETSQQLGLSTNIYAASDAPKTESGEISIQPEAAEQASGYAEVFPEHKFNIIKALQAEDHIVGMTGDGVNDAPALKQADVGIAVSRATDAARAAADLVLTLPGLSVVTRAIEEARKIFERMTSYATFRIAETIRVLLFMALSILAFHFYPVTPIMIVLLAILNDVPIMTIAYDNAPVAKNPVRWNMRRVLTIATTLGVMGVISTFFLYWGVKAYFDLPHETIQTIIFLKLLVAGHLTIFLTRNTGPIWQKPFPSWILITATELTQILGTLAAVYGVLIPGIGWGYALAVWGYSLVWFLINSGAKIIAYRILGMTQESYAME